MESAAAPAPYELLDDGFDPEPCDVLGIGCGNLLRGDDGVGPVLVRELAALQATGRIPSGAMGVRLVDGGTAGMDTAFAMRGARRVVLVDAARTGNEPGTLYRLPAEAVADVPPLQGLHTHAVRWDHALAFGAWLLGPSRPRDVTVFLIEAAGFEPGAPLSAPVDAAMHRLVGLLGEEFWPEPAATAELDELGYLRLPAALAAEHFPADACLGGQVGTALELMPLHSSANGGLVLKQRNAAGDRAVLVNEMLGFSWTPGSYPCTWDAERGRLVIDLTPQEVADDERVRRGDDGAPGARSLGGLPPGDLDDRGRGATPGGLSDPGAGRAGSRRGAPDGGPAPTAPAGDPGSAVAPERGGESA